MFEQAPPPDLSVVLVAPDTYPDIRATVLALREQAADARIELLVVAAGAHTLPPAADAADFAAVRLVPVPPGGSTAEARAAAVRAAAAPVVAFVEEHSFPRPGWATALLRAHRGPWAAVGPAIGNANPDTALSWANLLLEYGEWLEPLPAGELAHLPGHNCSYKRDVLLRCGARLAGLLEAESVLHWELRARGERLYLESAARIYHLNFSRPLPLALVAFLAGRQFAGARSATWGMPRRAAYAAGAPLIPLVRLRRIVREARRPGRPRAVLPRALPWLVALLAVSAAGELVGYSRGPGGAGRALAQLETRRARYLARGDRPLVAGLASGR